MKKLVLGMTIGTFAGVCLCLAVFLPYAWKSNNDIEEGKATSQRLASQYFEAVRKKDFDSLLSLYLPETLDKTGPEALIGTLKKANDQLGDLQKYDLESIGTKWTLQPPLIGRFFMLSYKVTYSKRTVTETLAVFEPLGAGGTGIATHRINSESPNK